MIQELLGVPYWHSQGDRKEVMCEVLGEEVCQRVVLVTVYC